jgi:peptidoglycan biosynthesis protein MviN/MurJ (putative lipid II flippase)
MNTALAQMIDFAVLLLLFRNRAGGIGGKELAGLMLKVLAISVAAGGAAFGLFRFFSRLVVQRFLTVLPEVLVCGCLGLLAYYLLARLFRIREVETTVQEFLTPLLRRLDSRRAQS